MALSRRLWMAGMAGTFLTPCQSPFTAGGQAGEGGAPIIEIWYGKRQRFGHRGLPQRFVNILGAVSPAGRIAQLSYTLNGGKDQRLSKGSDLHRLASPGDFNVEIDHADLKEGENTVVIRAKDLAGAAAETQVALEYAAGQRWPLPYSVDFTQLGSIERLAEVCQIVDGHWKLTPDGVRPVVPYYDRVLAFGDLNWSNYAVTAEVIFHGFPGPRQGGPGFGVNHAGLTFRFRGHHDDGNQPRIRWYPVGAATEFTLHKDLSQCKWRILPGPPRKNVFAEKTFPIELGKRYMLKGEVLTLPDGRNRYRDKIWASGDAEPPDWAVENAEDPYGDFQSGCALLIAHISDTTFRNVKIEAL